MKGYRRRCGPMMAMALLFLLSPLAVWAQQPKSGGTLRVAWEADLTGIDPHVSAGLQAYRVVGNLFNSLLTIDAEAPNSLEIDGIEIERVPLRAVDDPSGALCERYLGERSSAVYLLRPDQHVAARWVSYDADQVAAALARATGR
jgi:ABC-type transport system substrate-binding protein